MHQGESPDGGDYNETDDDIGTDGEPVDVSCTMTRRLELISFQTSNLLQAERSDSDTSYNESDDDDEASGEDGCAGDGDISDTLWPEDVEVSGMMLYHDLC